MAVTTTLTYAGNGATVNFTAPPIDVSVSQLNVYLDGVLQLAPADYTYSSITGLVTMVVPPAIGEQLALVRATSLVTRLVDFANESLASESVLDIDSKQAFYRLQEITFELSGTEQIKKDLLLGNNWNFQGLLAKNAGDPVDAQDLATKNYVDTSTNLIHKDTDWDATSLKIKNLNDPTNPQDAATQNYVVTTANLMHKTGGGQWDATALRIEDVAFPTASDHAATKGYVDTSAALIHLETGQWDAVSTIIKNVGTPVAGTDAATKDYVDTHNWLTTDITDFNAQVEAKRLDQFANPTADLNLGGTKITNSGVPTNPLDLATKAYVDGIGGNNTLVVTDVTVDTNVSMPSDHQKTFVNFSATGDVIMTLPNPNTQIGAEVTFVHNNAAFHKFEIYSGAAGRFMMPNGTITGNTARIRLYYRGESITLKAVRATTGGEWAIIARNNPLTEIFNASSGKSALPSIRQWVGFEYSFATHGGAVGDIVLGKMPVDCSVWDSDMRVTQNFSSGTSTADIALGITTDDATGIVASTIVTDVIWDQGWRDPIPDGTGPNATTQTTGTRDVVLTVGTEALTAGALILYLLIQTNI